jgi:rubredoxin/uncharacterized membrane protein
MKRWKCTVCGYIHEGDEPPEKCPICGADRSKFIEIDSVETAETETDFKDQEEEETQPGSETEATVTKMDPLFNLMLRHHVHPILVHIPNGVLPVSVVFIVLAAIFTSSSLSQAAFYNLVFVILTMPMVLFSGYIEWQKKYGGTMTNLFIIKITSASIVSLTTIILAVWLLIDPQIATSSSYHRWIFLLINLVTLVAAGTAGFIGGKFVFKD